MSARRARTVPTTRQASVVLLISGMAFAWLGGSLAVSATFQASPVVLVAAEDGVFPTMEVGMVHGGVFGFWAVRKPRTDVFKAASISLTVVFAPVAVGAVPLLYSALFGVALRASGYERCASPALERAYTTGSGRTLRIPTVFAHSDDGGCAGALARIGQRR